MKRVYIPNIKKYIEVNDDDFDKVSAYRWYITYAHGTQRCLAHIDGKKIALPRFLTGQINTYQKCKNLDFTRNNIGIDENKHRYRKPQKNSSSIYKGVHFSKEIAKYKVSINVNGKHIFLGSYTEEKEAGKRYNQAVIEYFNGNGYMNEIDE
ncbi:AP2 domain-containing protein [Staphylococcus aureus]|nr:AP2 domain-containing protein [Staphylococcus aureus]MVI00999.1 AP2 domain-containing protein [Staphylococcus aureus]MVI25738.1 AP2 domain-containing protein [Staphylococcus aureus]MVI29818.1 AP2 domain-containing protein [Staphylococcus aureus]MVI87374.1 AP2 domain-containing protein [Staphylococcus aureus]